MSDPTTYHRVTLKMASPFAKYGESAHIWSVKFSLSGGSDLDESDAEATALALWAPIQQLCTAATSLVGWLYYNAGSSTNAWQGTYEIGEHVGNQGAYSGEQYGQQLEVIVLARCPVGVNSKGRAKYLFKHIHDVVQGATAGEHSTITDPTDVLENWNSGSGPESLVPVDPTTGVAGGPWTLQLPTYTRQLRRGEKGGS